MSDIPIPKIGFKWSGIGCWRNVKLIPHIFNREDWLCWVDGCFGRDLSCHESLITRNDVKGWQPKERRILIYHTYNSIGLCSKHHNTELEPDKQDVFDWMCERYGKEKVIDWLREISLEFKVVPPFIRQILKGL